MKVNQELIDFLTPRTNLKTEELKPGMYLAKNLGFYGLAALGFFEEFFEKFEIKNVEAFKANLYIDGGPDFGLNSKIWIAKFLNPKKSNRSNPDVSLRHLGFVIEGGKWFDENKKS